MKNLLYHRVNPRFIKKVLDDGFLKPNVSHPISLDVDECICFTRDYDYMKKSRPFVVIFDRDVLKYHYKVVPVCLKGLIEQSNNEKYDIKKWSKILPYYGFECEERVYNKVISLELAEYVGYIKGV